LPEHTSQYFGASFSTPTSCGSSPKQEKEFKCEHKEMREFGKESNSATADKPTYHVLCNLAKFPEAEELGKQTHFWLSTFTSWVRFERKVVAHTCFCHSSL